MSRAPERKNGFNEDQAIIAYLVLQMGGRVSIPKQAIRDLMSDDTTGGMTTTDIPGEANHDIVVRLWRGGVQL